ncbi:hypothetical protein D3C84_702830 [compost metagenome]
MGCGQFSKTTTRVRNDPELAFDADQGSLSDRSESMINNIFDDHFRFMHPCANDMANLCKLDGSVSIGFLDEQNRQSHQ